MVDGNLYILYHLEGGGSTEDIGLRLTDAKRNNQKA